MTKLELKFLLQDAIGQITYLQGKLSYKQQLFTAPSTGNCLLNLGVALEKLEKEKSNDVPSLFP